MTESTSRTMRGALIAITMIGLLHVAFLERDEKVGLVERLDQHCMLQAELRDNYKYTDAICEASTLQYVINGK